MIVIRSIYGCIEAALLWYNLYTSVLKEAGFVISPYDFCVENKIINGKQCTIAWHVDDNKVSHKDENFVTDIIKMLEGHFGNFKTTRGKNHNYLGMIIGIRDDKKVETDMIKQIKAMIEEFSDEITGSVSSPASKWLYKLGNYNDRKLLVGKEKEEFHSFVQQLLHMCKCARPDIGTAVMYLTT